ncbi:MAG: DsbA family protein [Bacilli bacterium]
MNMKLKKEYQAHKAIDALLFVDPLCPDAWAFEPTVKRLHLTYGTYINFRVVLVTNLWKMNSSRFHPVSNPFHKWLEVARSNGMSCVLPKKSDSPINAPLIPLLAIKAAQLQGKAKAVVFMRRLQERLFLDGQDVSHADVLLECAANAHLDLKEFRKDVHDEATLRMLYDDFTLAKELDIQKNTTVVMYHYFSAKEGIRIPGPHPFFVYEQIITELLGQNADPSPLPELINFLSIQKFVATCEIQEIYGFDLSEISNYFKPYIEQGLVSPLQYGNQLFWIYGKCDL